MQQQPNDQWLNSGGIEVTVRYRDGSNVAKLVGTEQTLITLLALERPELLDLLVDAALERRLANLARDLKEDPDRFWREHIPPYTLPLPLPESDQRNGDVSANRGRKKGGTNASRAFFHEQYRNAVDGTPINMAPMQRPYRKSHFPPRTSFSYYTFDKYLNLWGAPTGYAMPGE